MQNYNKDKAFACEILPRKLATFIHFKMMTVFGNVHSSHVVFYLCSTFV